jgi:ATP-dependent RNA helicase HelY
MIKVTKRKFKLLKLNILNDLMTRAKEEQERRPKRDKKGSLHKRKRVVSEKSPVTERKTVSPTINKRNLRRLLADIGTPEPSPFKPDPFQLEALSRIELEDILVTAPTGSGKTWIAREEIRRLLEQGRRAWYTSPLKALTNSKYHEFSEEFGKDKVGILTGDRKENMDAPLIVGTTEIYRNQLFDSLRRGETVQSDLVILDEAHYMADQERGHVWEEAIILSPPRVRLLLLSATIGNADELVEWIMEVRGVQCGVVSRPGARPVPLRSAFLFPKGELIPLVDQSNRLNPEIAELMQGQSSRGRGFDGNLRSNTRLNMPEMPPSLLLTSLNYYDLLPAIVFLPTRRRCDEAAAEAVIAKTNETQDRRDERRHVLRQFAEIHPEIRKHRHWDMVIRGGVASHHAGHIPAWKLVIERLMSAGLLNAIFATATVAAGVDFPARTVVFTGVEARTGSGWRQLTASEFQQMTGRAGRRGRDRVGFIVVAPGTHQNPQRVVNLLESPPDPLESQFRATYTTLLNLLDAYGSFAQIRDIAEKSFSHRDMTERISRLEKQFEENEQLIKHKLTQLGYATIPMEIVRGFERLTSARTRIFEEAPQSRLELLLRWLDEEVIPGRVVSIGRSSRRLVFVSERRGANIIGTYEDGRRASLALERVGRVYSQVYKLSENKRDHAFTDTRAGNNPLVTEPRLKEIRAETEESVNIINDLLDKIAADYTNPNPHKETVKALWSVIKEAEALERIERRLEQIRAEVWIPFEKRARVLHHFGYIDIPTQQITERGRWLADLRLDRPLLVGEALQRGLFNKLTPAHAAGLMAALAADADRDFGELELDDDLVTTLVHFEEIAFEVATEEWKQGLEPAPEMNFSAAATTVQWAQGVEWKYLVHETRAEEGDLIRMLSRTGESLLQISNLRESHAEIARICSSAASAILREPVRPEEFQ